MSIATLAAAIERYTRVHPGSNPYATAIPGFMLVRADCPKPPMPNIYKPAICLVAQGAKRSTFGEQTLAYRAGQARVLGVQMPGIGCITDATAAEPFLGAVVEFDLDVMRDVLEGLDEPLVASNADVYGVFVDDFGPNVTGCIIRLIELLDTPRAIPTLAPAIMRELSYWLLSGPRGGDVASVVFGVDRSERVIATIHELRKRFTETIRVGELAEMAQMSPAAFHRNFKSMTSMTPLQYQKQLRLHEARNLMLSDAANAETAAYRVGYESASQFSREYSRMFGSPPRRDTHRAADRAFFMQAAEHERVTTAALRSR
jgi:AraC-like DNA-binding protein